ncbi:MAG: hypothetical protein J7K95_04340, partial [Thermoplasmata archaeon]|nr:hypothetical protein [Thermoplasmata archaeon]
MRWLISLLIVFSLVVLPFNNIAAKGGHENNFFVRKGYRIKFDAPQRILDCGVTVYLFEVNFEKNRKTHQQVLDTITDGIAKY